MADKTKQIPAFTVLKNGSILKNIFLLHKSSLQDSDSVDEQKLLVGRHPKCNITLEHPSISRHHLRIHSNPSLRSLYVVDLSSVHGTWVSGKKIEPGVNVRLKEGDTVKLGASSRVYVLHWVPASEAYDHNGQFLPVIYTIKEGEDETNQDEKLETRSWDDDLECSDISLFSKCHDSPIRKSNPLMFSGQNYLNSVCDDAEVEQLTTSGTDNENDETLGTVSVKPQSVVSGTKSVIDQLNLLNDNLSNEFEMLCDGTSKDDLFWPSSFSKSSCTSNENDEIFAKNSVQSPLAVPESIPARDISSNLKKSEDQLNWLKDDLNNEFELQNHGITKEDVFSMADCSSSSTDDAKVERLSPSNTGNRNGEIFSTMLVKQLPTSETITMNWLRDNLGNETFATVSIQAPLAASEAIFKTETPDSLYKSEDWLNWLRDNLSNEFEQLSYDTMKDARVSCKKHEKNSSKQDISRSIESDMCNESEIVNQQIIDNGSVPVTLLDGVNRDGDESFQPDRAGGEEVDMGCEFEKMNQANIADVSATGVPIDGVQSQVDNMYVKSESIDNEIMKQESVLVVPPAETCMDLKQTFTPDAARAKEVPMNLEALKNGSVLVNLFDNLDGNKLEIFTPDKENKDPKAYSVKSSKKRLMEDKHKISSHYTISKAAIRTPIVNEEKYLFSFSADTKNVFVQRSLNVKDMVDPLVYYEEAFLSTSEKETESRQGKMEGTFNTINFSQTVQKAIDSSNNFLGGAKEKWTMIVDTGSLLDAESLKHLTLLKGLKGTRLVIPKTVMRELMDIEIQNTFLKTSTKKATSALKWVEECMVSTRWWIHMDDEILLSSEAESHVLETALLLRKEITDQKVIILSNDLNVKIKAMAEGVMCEAAKEFHRSLVNPFSERFMWVGSLARGPTWSSIDDDVLRQKYYGCSLNGSHMLKGLKLLARVTTFQ